MATIGRPLSLHSITKTLDAIAADLPTDSAARQMLYANAATLAKAPLSARTLHFVVKELDQFLTNQHDWMGPDTATHLTKCIDSLALMEAKAKPTKKLPAKKLAKAPAHSVTFEPVVANQRKVSITSTEAIIGAIGVLLEEVADNTWNDNTFDTLRHLIDVLDNIVS